MQSLLSVVDVDMSALTVTFSLGPWINVLPERSDLNVFISSTASNVRAISLNKQALNFVCDLPFQTSAAFSAEVQVLSAAASYAVDFSQSIKFISCNHCRAPFFQALCLTWEATLGSF